VARVLIELQPATRREVFALIGRMIAKASPTAPAAKPPSSGQRVKISWVEPFTTRFLAEAPLAANDVDLAWRLGLPVFCRGAMRAARSRYRWAGLLKARAAPRRPRCLWPPDCSGSPSPQSCAVRDAPCEAEFHRSGPEPVRFMGRRATMAHRATLSQTRGASVGALSGGTGHRGTPGLDESTSSMVPATNPTPGYSLQR
jgi:hypothetical protein